MIAPWLAYQLEVAALFRSLGCTVEVEKDVAGARSIHAIDVLAKTTVAGIEPPRILRRLNSLGGLSHEQDEQVFT